ncbi:hypothetical protein Tco_0890970 [Tanacetum coccineum]|uniref:Uncharacterized protein n=1 Tax=Tanacetum coccineum TaxID=301880 RepID=A0ABQ5C506_9ASTR
MAAFWVVTNQFQKFIDSKVVHGFDSQMTDAFFVDTIGSRFKQTSEIQLLQHLGNVKKSLLKETRIRTKAIGQTQQCKMIAAGSGNDTDADDADIKPIYDEEPMAEEIDVLETMNIELEHSVAKLRKENETLKQHYKDLYDSIKITRSKTTEQTTSLLANNADLKAQIQEKLRKIQERDRNSTTSVPTSARIQTTTDDRKPNPRSNNQTSRSLPVSKSSRVTITVVPKADHSKSSSSFSDSKNFVFSYKTSVCVMRKARPRSVLGGNHGRIFKSVGLRWIPTGKLFDSCTSKVDSEPPHGSNVDIPNIHECKQTLDVSAGTSINVQKEQSLDLSADSSLEPHAQMESDPLVLTQVTMFTNVLLDKTVKSRGPQCQENVPQVAEDCGNCKFDDDEFINIFSTPYSSGELHPFDRLDVWELVDRPLCKNVINLKWLWKNKRDEENTVIRNKSPSCGLRDMLKRKRIDFESHLHQLLGGSCRLGHCEEVYVNQQNGLLTHIIPPLTKFSVSRTAYYGLKQANRAWYDEALPTSWYPEDDSQKLADCFTKHLSEDRFKYLYRQRGMRCLIQMKLEVLAIESA